MVFARKDLEILLPMDADRDGKVDGDEFSSVQALLGRRVSGALIVLQSGIRRPSDSIRLKQIADDAIALDLHFDLAQDTVIELRMPLIAQLARGHRLHLSVKDANGNLIAQHIVDANSPNISSMQIRHRYCS